MIVVLDTPPFNTVQDLGRPSYRHLGVGCSGAMDTLALQAGNILLGNDVGDACIELQTYPFVVRLDAATSFVVTGVDASITLDGRPVLPWFVAHAGIGQTLAVHPPRSGARAYVCVAGGLDVPVVLGSRSTQMRGGFGGKDGRPLAVGDVLKTRGGPAVSGYGALPPALGLNDLDHVTSGRPDEVVDVRAIPATDHDRFTNPALEQFWTMEWRVTPQSDRVGYRLKGESLSLRQPMELRSYGILPGIVQVPPAGEPIVQLADANTAGGYPRIACVIEADLWRLGQARIGRRIRFHRCDHLAGTQAMRPVEAYLADLRMMADNYRASQVRRSGGAA